MHPELDKLIEMALADGQVTDKEREIILRKADKLSLDVDEVEMYLEGIIQKLKNTNINSNSEKIKSIKSFNTKKIEYLSPAILKSENDLEKSIEDFELKRNEELETINQLKKIVNNYIEDISFKKSNIENLLIDLKSKYIQHALLKFFNDYNNKEIKKFYFTSPEIVIKNSWLHGFKSINKKMDEKFDNLIFALSNSVFFFDTFLIIENTISGLSIEDIRYKLENNKNNSVPEYFTYLYNGELRKIKWKSEGYTVIKYDEILVCEYSISNTNDKYNNKFTVLKLGEVSYRIKEKFLGEVKSISISIPLHDLINDVFKPAIELTQELLNKNEISTNSITIYRNFLTTYLNTTESKESNDLNELINDLNELINDLNARNNQLIEKTNFVKIIENKIQESQRSIENEHQLKKFPCQATGSVTLYNKLNENYTLYDETQFNKIIRFLDHLENKEKNYRDLYITCTNEYVSIPNTIPIKELKQEQKEINDCYKILLVLVEEVNGDVVKFNKVYNTLEDIGLFMTMPEKMTQQYLSEISTKLDNVIQGLKVLFQSLEETNRTLGEISSNMYDVNYHLWDISWNVSSLNS